jgi:ATP-dependent Zn protease
VRGARRRARKAGRSISQEDLLAEITGKPRDPGSMPVMTQEEIEYTAVHEAGHAIARCLGSSQGKDITFVSIVPRADGTLGFVAFAPSEQQSVTRAEYIEYLEIALAGRAAEEIRFGADGVTSGAENDLYKATRMAISMISRYGLGAEGSLVWVDTPTRVHMEQVDKLLVEVYTSIKSKLLGMRGKLYALASRLQEQQELTGRQVLQIMSDI